MVCVGASTGLLGMRENGMNEHDLVVIGAGPGGYVAAIRAAQLGMNVACIEKDAECGGTCLRVGCIPSKALLESSERYAEAVHDLAAHGVAVSDVRLDLDTMMRRKDGIVSGLAKGIDGLFRKHGITRYVGTGRFVGPGRVQVDGPEPVEVRGRHILIATGSVPASLPDVPFDGDRIGSSTEALRYPEVPKHLVVIGAGYIGLELGTVWARLGAQVTVLEYLPRILPGMDAELALAAQKVFRKRGLDIRVGSRVLGAETNGDHCTVEVEGSNPMECDRVLVAVGRKPYADGLGLEAVGVELNEKGRIRIDAHFATTADGVYAIGDVVDGPMLAHKAEEEGVAFAEQIATGAGHVNYGSIPGVCYTQPEVASVGMTEEALKEADIAYRKGSFPFVANGRARSLGHTEGFVKVLADAGTDRVLGVHILGAGAGELIAEAGAAMEFGATSEDLARTCHAHPTLSEALREASLAVDERTIHI